MTGFIELMERAQREAQELHEEARRTLQSAREEASRVRAEANAEADLVRQQAGIDAEFLRRDAERLWAAFSRLLAAASEVVNIIGPMVPSPPGESGPEAAPVPEAELGNLAPEGPEAEAPMAVDPGVGGVSEEELSEAERELRGLLENH